MGNKICNFLFENSIEKMSKTVNQNFHVLRRKSVDFAEQKFSQNNYRHQTQTLYLRHRELAFLCKILEAK